MNRTKTIVQLAGTFLPSSLRLWTWRRLGFKVGRGAKVSFLSVVVADHIDLGAGATIEPLTLIYAPKRLVLKERSRIAGFNRIIGFGEIELGPQSFVGLGNLMDTTGGIFVGARSHVGPRGTYYSHGSTGLIFNQNYPHRIGPIRIGEDCWLGMNCTVYPNVNINDGCLIYGGLTLTGNIAARKAVLPPEHPHRQVPVEMFTHHVTTAQKLQLLENTLTKFQKHHPHATLTSTSLEFLTLNFQGKRIILLKGANACPTDLHRDRDVVWSLLPLNHPVACPIFNFTDLTVVGEWTSFADQVARFLCDWNGIHFVFFDPIHSGTGNPSLEAASAVAENS